MQMVNAGRRQASGCAAFGSRCLSVARRRARLWSGLLLSWIVALRRDRPGVALRTHVNSAERLLDRVQMGTLDIAIMYTPYSRPGIETTPLFEEELIAVSTSAKARNLSPDDYVYVEWPDFTPPRAACRGSQTLLCVATWPTRYRHSGGGRHATSHARCSGLLLVEGCIHQTDRHFRTRFCRVSAHSYAALAWALRCWSAPRRQRGPRGARPPALTQSR